MNREASGSNEGRNDIPTVSFAEASIPSAAVDMEDRDYVDERLSAHTTTFDGAKDQKRFPGEYAAYRAIQRFRISGVDSLGLSSADEAIVRQAFLDPIEIEAISQGAGERFLDEMCSRLKGGDTNVVGLALLIDQAEEAEVNAVKAVFDDVVDRLSEFGRRAVLSATTEVVSTTWMARVDRAGVAADLPEYMFQRLKARCARRDGSDNGIPDPRVFTPPSEQSGGFSVESLHDD